MTRRAALGLLCAGAWLIARAAAGASEIGDRLPSVPLRDAEGTWTSPVTVARGARLTAFVFRSTTCPCFAAHRPALARLASRFRAAGVRLVLVDSERDSTDRRAEPGDEPTGLPIFVDDRGAFARAVGAGFATFSLLAGADGRILYRGGIDSARKDVAADAKPFLSDAIEAALAGRAPAPAVTKALGCSLRL